jgi:hypothetical protein
LNKNEFLLSAFGNLQNYTAWAANLGVHAQKKAKSNKKI